jgi:hypothetical protein
MHTSEQFTRTERLRDIVIGAKLEHQHLVHFIRHGAEHNHRDGRSFTPNRATDFPSVNLGKLKVQDDERGRSVAERFDSGSSICREIQTETIGFEHVLQGLVERTIVFNNKHPFHKTYLDIALFGRASNKQT